MGRRNAGARYRELGAELRKRREAAGVTADELARRTDWTPVKISRMETGQVGFDSVAAVIYLGECGITRAQTLDLLAQCREAQHKLGYWLSPHGEWLEDSLSTLIYHERTAAKSTIYEPLLVHGLLQTADYARSRIAAAPLKPAEIEQAVEIRLQRQQILHGPESATFDFFLHEQALRLDVGSPAIMHEQLLKLVLLAALSHITIRVVPASAAFGGPFRLLEYKQYPPLVYLDNCTTGLFLEDKEYVAPFRTLVSGISDVALDEGQSRELIAALASECDHRSAHDLVEEEQL